MWFAEKRIIDFLNCSLNLPASGKEQDWEIELADFSRLDEFINFLIHNDFAVEIKKAITALIISSFDDSINLSCFSLELWKKFENFLCLNLADYEDVLQNWLSTEDEFAVTQLLRLVKKECD